MAEDPIKEKKEKAALNAWTFALGTGSQLAVSVGGGVWLGWKGDEKFGTAPWLLIFGSVLGLTVGLYQLIKASSQVGRGQKRD